MQFNTKYECKPMLNCAYCTQIMVLLDLNKDMSKGMQTKKNLLRT